MHSVQQIISKEWQCSTHSKVSAIHLGVRVRVVVHCVCWFEGNWFFCLRSQICTWQFIFCLNHMAICLLVRVVTRCVLSPIVTIIYHQLFSSCFGFSILPEVHLYLWDILYFSWPGIAINLFQNFWFWMSWLIRNILGYALFCAHL